MVQVIVHHRWFIRLVLAIFWVIELIAYILNMGFITYLLTYHTWLMLIILFLTFKYMLEPFYAPFLKITTSGGEIIMEKSTKVMLVAVAILGSLVVAMAIEPSRNAIIFAVQQGILNPIYYIGVGFNNWLGTYPALWILGSGLLGGLVLAIMLNTLLRPKLGKKTPQLKRTLTIQREPAEPEPAPKPSVTIEQPVEEPVVEEALT